jgi:DNA sulfur modification protein DndD
MILTKLALHNFGIYGGKHEIDLTIQKDKPIVLFGALNGSGKTTLLESIQFALFGKNAKFIPKTKTAYLEFLKDSINRKNLDTSASVAVTFETRKGNHITSYEVVRTWSVNTNKSQLDSVQLFKNGEFDEELSNRWPELSENFFPSQLSDLFFFDGERIESLAQQDRCSELIRTGLNSLLGLDLVSDLSKTLTTLERKLKLESSGRNEKEIYEQLEKKSKEITSKRELLSTEIQECYAEREVLHSELAIANETLIREGGDLFKNREELKAKQDFLNLEVIRKRTELVEIASSTLPLSLLENRIKKIEELSLSSLSLTQREAVRDAIANFSDCVLYEAKQRDFSDLQIDQLQNIHSSLLEITKNQTSVPEIHCSRESLYKYRTGIANIQSHAMTSLVELTQIKNKLELIDKQISAIPAEDKVLKFVELVSKQEELLKKLNIKIEALALNSQSLEKEFANNELKINETISAFNTGKAEEILFEKMKFQLARGKNSLQIFEERIRNKHISNLEKGIKEAFDSLLRKKDFLKSISISKVDYQMTINIVGGETVPSSKLSAGERQLLAVAVLWALAKLSGRKLPTVIDTPLGRLDSKHRKFFVENYFPNAGHQVILLSTDEEIVGGYYNSLKSSIAKEYLVEYNEIEQSSVVSNGYFTQEKVSA